MTRSVSLIVSTVGRTEELDRLFMSLLPQREYLNSIVLVDQNTDARLDIIVERYRSRLPIEHVRSELGLSRGRNVGLALAAGDLVCFPDDDCFYSADTLEKVTSLFQRNSDIDFISVSTEDPDIAGRGLVPCPKVRTGMSLKNIVGCSFTLFFRRRVTVGVGKFDEQMGVGANSPFGSCEEIDYLTRALNAGFLGVYVPSPIVFHSAKQLKYSYGEMRRQWKYGAGFAYYLFKNRRTLGWRICAGRLFGELANFAIALTKGRLFFLKGAYLGGIFAGFLRVQGTSNR